MSKLLVVGRPRNFGGDRCECTVEFGIEGNGPVIAESALAGFVGDGVFGIVLSIGGECL